MRFVQAVLQGGSGQVNSFTSVGGSQRKQSNRDNTEIRPQEIRDKEGQMNITAHCELLGKLPAKR